jgi:lipoprotein-anchoring transpeptidase ErfK/SrfK
MNFKNVALFVASLVVLFFLVQCSQTIPKQAQPAKVIQYERFKDSVLQTDTVPPAQTANIFDADVFTPGQDSLEKMLVNMDTLLHRQVALMEYLDTVKSRVKKTPGYSEEEKAAIRANVQILDSFLTAFNQTVDSIECRGKDCLLFVEIDKSKQQLYLYLLGELKDSFAVSTGKGKKYETPKMELRPHGPVVTKYTSKKFPGGNYMQLGNMPYAVFLKGGYAIHGTTPGNFAKLGTRASHGCIRIHPDNAKVLNSLVRMVGLRQTWVSIRDSLP